MKTIEELNEKWWYRLLKVCFVIFVILTFWLPTFFVLVELEPRVDPINTTYALACEDGSILDRQYSQSELNRSATDFWSLNLNVGNEQRDILEAKLLCANTSLSRSEVLDRWANDRPSLNPAPRHQNYSFLLIEEKFTPSYGIYYFSVFMSVIGTVAFFLIVRATFLYVLIQAPFWRTLIFRNK